MERSLANRKRLIRRSLSIRIWFIEGMLAAGKRLIERMPVIWQGAIERDWPARRQSAFSMSTLIDCGSSSKRRFVLFNITVSIPVPPVKESCDQSRSSNRGGDPQKSVFPYTISPMISAVVGELFVLHV